MDHFGWVMGVAGLLTMTMASAVLAHGPRYLRTTGLFLVVDAVFVALLATYLLASI